jgi:hypothetical protein
MLGRTRTSVLLALVLILYSILVSNINIYAINEDEKEISISDNDTHEFSGELKSIIIKEGCNPTIIINNLTINAEDTPAIWIMTNSSLTLVVKGENNLYGGTACAGICVEPAYDSYWNYSSDESGSVTIQGDGILNCYGGDAITGMSTCTDNTGSGAGIGGNGQNYDGQSTIYYEDECAINGTGKNHKEHGNTLGCDSVGVDFGTVIIDMDDGTVNAVSGKLDNINDDLRFGDGAGIGSGGQSIGGYWYFEDYIESQNWGNPCGNIIIKKGTVNAKSSNFGAGIGSGAGFTHGFENDKYQDNNINITIDDGTINASCGNSENKYDEGGAGIGGGAHICSGNITINGGGYNSFR